MTRGVLAGFPVIDVHVKLVDGSYHDVDSNQAAFEVAGSLAFQEGARAAGIHLLEPMMAVEIRTPEAYMGDVTGDVNARRGAVQQVTAGNSLQIIDAEVPLASMFGYATDLRSKTQGRASYAMSFLRYAPVPPHLADQIVARMRGI